jgi:hypothetical protein
MPATPFMMHRQWKILTQAVTPAESIAEQESKLAGGW